MSFINSQEMPMKATHIVLTTINLPIVLETLWENLNNYGHLDRCKVWVVADLKTPMDSEYLCHAITKKGLETRYLSIHAQDAWGQGVYHKFYQRIPYNNETRRNIGYLFALEDGCQRLICIDDDNFPVPNNDFIGGHCDVGSPCAEPLISTESGFYNLCDHLEIQPKRIVYPRGYPFELRGVPNSQSAVKADQGAVIGVRAGLWLHDPDVDATTWLNGKVFGVRYNGPVTGVLAQDTWTPINTQNTCIFRDLIPAFLCVPMGWDVPGGKLQRYCDIWGGYFLQALMKRSSYHVAFGQPIVEHRRNHHVYIDDLRAEYWGMILTDWLVKLLKEEFDPTRGDVVDRVEELSIFLKTKMQPSLPKWCPSEIEGFFDWTAGNLSTWADACRHAMLKSG